MEARGMGARHRYGVLHLLRRIAILLESKVMLVQFWLMVRPTAIPYQGGHEGAG
jgi:hypothetical protein